MGMLIGLNVCVVATNEQQEAKQNTETVISWRIQLPCKVKV